MQVTIGIKHAARDRGEHLLLRGGGVEGELAGAATEDITLSDDKGRKIFVPAGSLAYVEVGEASPRRGGFGV